jgi:hypothetical protein
MTPAKRDMARSVNPSYVYSTNILYKKKFLISGQLLYLKQKYKLYFNDRCSEIWQSFMTCEYDMSETFTNYLNQSNCFDAYILLTYNTIQYGTSARAGHTGL